MSKINLTEATMLALQGKLQLEESVEEPELEVVETEVTEPVEDDIEAVEKLEAAVDVIEEVVEELSEEDKEDEEVVEELPVEEPVLEESKEIITEDVEVKTDNVDVIVGEEATVVEDEESTIIVQNKETEEVVEEPVITEIPTEEVTVDEMVEEPVEVVEEQPEETEVIEESKLEEGRLNFLKYGIERDPSLDFSDDGSTFKGYRYNNGMPITYLKANGQVYLCIRVDYMNGLTYDEYSELPSYSDCDKYNGVDEDKVDLQDVADICKRIKAEYDEAVKNVVEVSDEAYKEVTDKIQAVYTKLLTDAKAAISELDLLELSDWDLRDLRRHLASLKNQVESWSWEKQKSVSQEMRRKNSTEKHMNYHLDNRGATNFYFKEIMEIVEKNKAENKEEALEESRQDDIRYIVDILNENKAKFSSKSFNAVIENYLKENNENVKSFELTKVLKNESKLKIEGLLRTEKSSMPICLEMNKVQSGSIYTKYELVESKRIKTESKENVSKVTMVTSNKDNILECKYIIKK